MQPSPPPPAPASGIGIPRQRLGLLLAFGALVLVVAAGVGGYLVGVSGIGHATLRIQVTNNTGGNLTVQVSVNGALVSTLPVAAGQTSSVDVPVAYATANGAAFQVSATTPAGPHDSSTVFVSTPSTFVVNLSLG